MDICEKVGIFELLRMTLDDTYKSQRYSYNLREKMNLSLQP